MTGGHEPPVTLCDLARSVASNASRGDAELHGITHDSRRVEPGWLFLAARGTQVDGHQYVPAAVEAGAAALVVERFLDVPSSAAAALHVNAVMVPWRLSSLSSPHESSARLVSRGPAARPRHANCCARVWRKRDCGPARSARSARASAPSPGQRVDDTGGNQSPGDPAANGRCRGAGGRARGVITWTRPISRRRNTLRCRRLHEPHARTSGLPRHCRAVLGVESPTVRACPMRSRDRLHERRIGANDLLRKRRSLSPRSGPSSTQTSV